MPIFPTASRSPCETAKASLCTSEEPSAGGGWASRDAMSGDCSWTVFASQPEAERRSATVVRSMFLVCEEDRKRSEEKRS